MVDYLKIDRVPVALVLEVLFNLYLCDLGLTLTVGARLLAMSTSSFLRLAFLLLQEQHLDFMHLTVDVGEPAVSDGSTRSQDLLLIVLYTADVLSSHDVVVFSFVFLWVLQDGLLLLLFKIDLHWHRLAFNLHVVH